MKKIRALVLGYMFFNPISQRGINVLTKTLAELSMDVDFVSYPIYFAKKEGKNYLSTWYSNNGGIVSNKIARVNIPYSSSHFPNFIKKSFIKFFEQTHVHTSPKINFEEYDVVVIESGKGVFFADHINGPILIYRQSDPVEFGIDPSLGIYERKLIEKADLTLVVNESIKEIYEENYPHLISKMRVWENGFEPLKERMKIKNPFDNTKKNVVYFGLFPIDIKLLIFASEKMPDVHFHIFGYFNKRYSIPKNLHFHGFIPHKELIPFINNADIFILPYKDDKKRLSIVEKTSKILLCMSTKKPIIASNFTNSDKLEKYGVVISNSNENFVEKIREFLEKPVVFNYNLDLKKYLIQERVKELKKILVEDINIF